MAWLKTTPYGKYQKAGISGDVLLLQNVRFTDKVAANLTDDTIT
ncbi:hypothetical protein [Photobacterium nomapromontoriensis]